MIPNLSNISQSHIMANNNNSNSMSYNMLNSMQINNHNIPQRNQNNTMNIFPINNNSSTNSINNQGRSPSLPGLRIKTNTNKNNTALKNSVTNSQFYCPCCSHCNKMEEQNLDSQIFSIKEAKGILSKAVEYIITHDMISKTNFDLFNIGDKESVLFSNTISNETKTKDDFDIENFHNNFPKQISVSNRETYKIVAYFLNALVDDKLLLNYLAPPELAEKLNQMLIPQVKSFDIVNDNIFYDPELENLFDKKSKEIVKSLFKKKYLVNLNEGRRENENNIRVEKRKMAGLYLVFIQLLAEISMECRERAVLLYKFFKLYFVEQEKKWIGVVNRMKQKVQYYKDLCKTVIQSNNKHLDKVETINDILFAQKVTKENLDNHKKLIEDLLKIINEKREETYILKANNEILDQELRLWIFDYDNLKLKKNVREELHKFSMENVVRNVNEELRHKSLSTEVKSLLVNADKFLIVSGQRNYFYEQKIYYISEIDRLSALYQKAYYKKGDYKKKLEDHKNESMRQMDLINKEVNFLRQKISIEKEENGVQTEVNFFEFNKMRKNHDLVVIHKKLTTNKLREFVERIEYGCSKNKPISMKSLLNFIPDLYNEKVQRDTKADLENGRREFFDDFLFEYMTEKFKMKKIIKRNTEEFIMAILKYTSEDTRIDLLRRFLGIGENKIRKEVFEMYLTFLKNIPISFFKLFDDDYKSYLMNTEFCFEVYHSRYPHFKLVDENKTLLIKQTIIFDSNEKETKKVNDGIKLDYFLLNRFYNKSFIIMNDLLKEFRNKKITEINYDKISDQFKNVNKEFSIPDIEIIEIFKRNFIVRNNKINLDSFFSFFANNKYSFKIKIFDFLDTSLNNILMTFNILEKRITKYYDIANHEKIGSIYYKDFEMVIMKITNGVDNKWKIADYFKAACGSQDKDFLSKEDFFEFFLNTKEMISILLSGVYKE